MNVSHLLDDFETLNKLAAKMDDYNENNHVRFGEWLIRNNKIDEKLKKKLKGLEKYFHGGGSPTLAFLQANSTNNVDDMVSKLRNYAKEKKRNDVVEVLNGICEDKKMKDLEDNVKTEIADLLDRRVVGAADWESFASLFGFKHNQRKVLLKSL